MLSATVLIVGSGPIGLWLALELCRANIDVLVIDKRLSEIDREPNSKALNLSASSLATFDSRGLASVFLADGLPMYSTHFGGLETLLNLNQEVLGVQYSFNLRIPQGRTEKILLDMCLEAGVRFEWGLKFLHLSQKDNTVMAIVEKITANENGHAMEPIVIRSSWLVGCDGTHSSVRTATGFPFEGISSKLTGIVVDAQFSNLPDAAGGWIVRRVPEGSALVTPVGDGKHHRFVGFFRDPLHHRDSEEVTEAEVKHYLETVFGSDLGMHSPLWLSQFGSASRIATSFRSGRVFIAGDAAHQLFAAGGQGMNVGIQDATNLAWKLALVIKSGMEAQDMGFHNRVLDTYSPERLAAAKDVCENTLAQMALLLANQPHETALREVFMKSLSHPEINSMWAQRVCGFGEPTAPFRLDDQDHPMIGQRATHLRFHDSNFRMSRELGVEHFILVMLAGNDTQYRSALEKCITTSTDRATLYGGYAHGCSKAWKDIGAVLLRPDEHIAWVGMANVDVEEMCKSLTKLLKWWLG